MSKGINKLGFVRALGAMFQRTGLMSQLGLGFGGTRDYYTTFGYQKLLKPADLFAKYIRQDVAETIVNAPANALWTNPPIVQADDAFMKAWEELLGHTDVWKVLNRADKMTGYGRFSAIVVGTDKSKASTPSVQRLLYMQPYSELSTTVEKLDNNTASPRFGLPTEYKITPQNAAIERVNVTSAVALRPFTASHENVIHIVDRVVEDNVYGTPALFGVYNLLDDLLKVAGGTAEVYWLTANRGMQLDIDKEMELTEDDRDALVDEVEQYVHGLSRVLRTRGVKVNELGSDTPSPQQTFEMLLALISAKTRIPKRILVGSEAGQLASEQDRANWAERIGERRKDFGEPNALTPLIRKLVDLNVLPQPENLNYVWPEAFILAPLERAQTSAQKARSAANLSKVMETTPGLMTKDEARKIIGLGDEQEVLSGTVRKAPVAINSRR